MKAINMKVKNQSGQTIIEAIVALMTILIIITAIAIVIVNALYNSQYIKNQNEANKYAQEGIEIVRNIQKNDLQGFQDFVGSGALYCVDEQTNTLTNNECYDNIANTAGTLNRTITFSSDHSDCESVIPNAMTNALKVIVAVKWTSSKCPSNNTFCHQSVQTSCLPYQLPASNP